MLAAALISPATASAADGRSEASPETTPRSAADAAGPSDTASDPDPDSGEEEVETPQLESDEQGQAPLRETFGGGEVPTLPKRPLLEALRATTFRMQLRTFFFERHPLKRDDRTALATGGSVGFRTGHILNRVALAATGYTSQKVHAPADEGGTGLLQPGPKGYTVLGEAYAEVLLADGVVAHFGRIGLDLPYINRADARMTPNTFEVYSVRGVFGGKDGRPQLRLGAGYVDQMKKRNSTNFLSMAQIAGAPAGVARGVFVAGGVLQWGELTIGAANFFSEDILNILYGEATYSYTFADPWYFRVATQYTDQRSTGSDLLTGEHFSTGQYGLKTEVGNDLVLLTAALTGVRKGADLLSPWGFYPTYASIQMRDFERKGEEAYLLRAATKIPGIEGLSVYGLWAIGTDPNGPSRYAVQEWDFNAQWDLSAGILDGLSLRLRYAHVEQDGGGSPTADDFRIIFTYDPPILRPPGPS